MALLNRSQILAAQMPAPTLVPVPELGGEVLVRGLTGAERDEYEAGMLTGKGRNKDIETRGMRARLLSMTIVDEAGNRMFSESDVEGLGKLSAAGLERIFDVAQALSGLGDKKLEEVMGNSKSEPSGSNGTGSPVATAAPSASSKKS